MLENRDVDGRRYYYSTSGLSCGATQSAVSLRHRDHGRDRFLLILLMLYQRQRLR